MRHRTALLFVDDTPTAPAPVLEKAPSTIGDIGEIPLPSITDMAFQDTVMTRGESDPLVDIVIMYRKRCGHCKPEISRVYKYVLSHPHVSAHVVEVDRDSNVDWLKSQLLDEDEGTPSTGYWAHGKLQLSSPSRAQPVDHWVQIARAGAVK